MPDNDRRVFPEARQVLDHLLDSVNSRAPGLIIAAHITGSIALGDGRPGQSDIDLVLVRNNQADNTDTMAALEPVLADLRREHPCPTLDGLVLGSSELEAGPDRIEGERPVIFESVARLDSGHGLRNPVTWATLRQCGITWHGPAIEPGRLWHDPARLDAWTRDNLMAYWRPWLAQLDRLTMREDITSLIEGATEWVVLGVTRLHFTLATGHVTSKHGAGLYALETFSPKWHPIIEQALRIRERRHQPTWFPDPIACIGEMRTYVAMVIDDALALPVAPHGIAETADRPAGAIPERWPGRSR